MSGVGNAYNKYVLGIGWCSTLQKYFWVPDFCFPFRCSTQSVIEKFIESKRVQRAKMPGAWEGARVVCPLHYVMLKVTESESTSRYFSLAASHTIVKDRRQVTTFRRRVLKSAGRCQTITSKKLQSPVPRGKEGWSVLGIGKFYWVLVFGDFGVTRERPSCVRFPALSRPAAMLKIYQHSEIQLRVSEFNTPGK